MKSKPLLLKPRGATSPIVWEEIAVDAPEVGPQTSLDDAQFVALDDARATAMVFRALITRAREQLGWKSVGDVVAALPRPVIDRTPPSRRGSSAGPAQGARGRTAPPRSGAPAATPRATSPAPNARRGRSSRRRRSGSSGSPGGSRA